MVHTHHNHTHDHHSHMHHHHAPQTFNRAFAISTVGLTLFTIVEMLYALHANSMSLVADAGHSFGDILGLLMAWGASWLMTLPSRERYSYGYKRTTILAALANALILIFTCTLIMYESIQRYQHPQVVNEQVMMWVAAAAVIVNIGAALLFQKGHHDLNIKTAYMHLVADALISVGVIVTALGIKYTGWLWLDPVASFVIVLIILIGMWDVLRDSVDLLLDAVPHRINHRSVTEYLRNLPGVQAIHDLHIWGLSTQEVALTAHLIMPDRSLTDEEYQTIYHTLKVDFQIDHVTLQVEVSRSEDPCGQVTRC